jgi:predicted enzyme related to lactoylglutathione lyase
MSNPVGSFIWYELMTSDADAAAQFYGTVIGWNIGARSDLSPSGKDYRMIGRSDGGFEGGVLALTPEMVSHGARPTWLGYHHVIDVDASVQAIVADGGGTLMPAMDLPVGRIAMMADPMGTPFYVMKPIPPPDKPNARSDVFDPTAKQRVNWNELASPDLARAKSFYSKHFGFEFKEAMNMGPMGDYCFITHDGVPRIGAIMQASKNAPSHAWLFYFGVSSIAAAKEAIESSGGRLLNGPHEVPGGQWIIIASDPQGAVFGVVGARDA